MNPADNEQAAAARVLAVLGMHRSGTSMLTGTLQEAGVFLGKVFRDPIKHNRKGLMEPKAVLFMHEDLFHANGGSWKDPPAELEWKPLHLAVRDLFIDSMAGQPLWGFKDPRTLFTLDGWRNALPQLEPVGIFRHPLPVAESLQRRNGFPLEQGFAIWARYNERLLALHAGNPFPVIEFRPGAGTMRDSLERLVSTLELPVRRASSEFEFFDEGIPSGTPSGRTVPPEADALYERLVEIAL